jgi:hypothetical protein
MGTTVDPWIGYAVNDCLPLFWPNSSKPQRLSAVPTAHPAFAMPAGQQRKRIQVVIEEVLEPLALAIEISACRCKAGIGPMFSRRSLSNLMRPLLRENHAVGQQRFKYIDDSLSTDPEMFGQFPARGHLLIRVEPSIEDPAAQGN